MRAGRRGPPRAPLDAAVVLVEAPRVVLPRKGEAALERGDLVGRGGLRLLRRDARCPRLSAGGEESTQGRAHVARSHDKTQK